MYTIKRLLDEQSSACMLTSARDWNEALEKAAQFRKHAVAVEIWNENGVKVPDPEIARHVSNPANGLFDLK